MGVTNVACPHCGRETLVTLTLGYEVRSVSKSYWGASQPNSQAACSRCGKSFYVTYRKIR